MLFFLPDRIGFFLNHWLGRVGAILLEERDRWALWGPVAFGTGISIYFSAPVEPALWLGPLGVIFGLAFLFLVRHRSLAPLLAVALLFMGFGFGAAQLRSWMVAAPILERPTGAIDVQGRVLEIEPLGDGGARVTLDQVILRHDGVQPRQVRIKLKKAQDLDNGQIIQLRANLLPPPQPAVAGAFDFARHAWFLELGGIGTALTDPDILPQAPPSGSWVEINRLRLFITRRILAQIPGDAGAVAAALVAGETAQISKPMMDAYRDSGLAHILSISGLHMSLAAGMVFFVVRGGLALFPAIALRYPIKKWAAVIALLTTFFYNLLAGAPVPAQRSFLMTALVLLAVLLDRSALSLRSVAVAAVVVLVLHPEALVGPSFQMSFAAVAALIACFEVAASRLAAWKARYPGWTGWGLHYVSASVLSSLVAGLATAAFGIYHFNRFAVWSVAANALAVPLSGAAMPFAALSLILMPLGLDRPFLWCLGQCIQALNGVAQWVAGWPAAAITLPVLPMGGLIAISLGLAWLVIWRHAWRLLGILPILGGLASMAFFHPPDLVVDGRGYGFGVLTERGDLLVNRGGRIQRESWSRRVAPAAAERWPRQGHSRDGRLACDDLGCLYRVPGWQVALVQADTGIAPACGVGDVVIASVPIREACRGPKRVIDRFDLWRYGAHSVYLSEGRVQVQTVAAWQGDRPWSHRPHRRKKTPEPAKEREIPADPVQDED